LEIFFGRNKEKKEEEKRRNILRQCYNSPARPLKSCAPHPWGFVVESARRYECRSVQSAKEYIMYLDTDALSLTTLYSIELK